MVKKSKNKKNKNVPLSKRKIGKSIAIALASITGTALFAGGIAYFINPEGTKEFLNIGNGTELVEENKESDEIKDLKSKINILEESIKILESEKETTIEQLNKFKAELESEKELTEEQKLQIEEFELEIENKNNLINSLNTQILELQLKIQQLENDLKNNIADNLNILEVNKSVSSPKYIFNFEDKILIINNSYALIINKNNSESTSINLSINTSTTYKIFAKKIDDNNVILGFTNTGNYAKVFKINIENETYDEINFFDSENVQISNVKYMYNYLITSDNKIYVSTNSGVFKIEDNKLNLIFEITSACYFNEINDDIYINSTYLYKLDKLTNEVIKLTEESISNYNKTFKDKYGNLIIYSELSSSKGYLKFIDEDHVLSSSYSFGNKAELINGILVNTENNNYFDNKTKSVANASLIGIDFKKEYIETETDIYYFSTENGLICENKETGERIKIESDSNLGYVFEIEGKYYFKGQNSLLQYLNLENKTLETFNVKGGLSVSKNHTSMVKIDGNRALLFNNFNNYTSVGGSIAVVDLEINEYIYQLSMGSREKFIIKDNYFYTYDLDSFNRLNLTTLEADEIKVQIYSGYNQEIYINEKNQALLVNAGLNGVSYVIDLTNFTSTIKYGVSTINKFNDYFMLNMQNGTTYVSYLYDFESDKFYFTQTPISKVIADDGTEFLISSGPKNLIYFI